MEQRLPLAAPALKVASCAVLLQLRHVSPDEAPSFDLSQLVRMPSPGIVPAIPLEPAAGIIRMNPSLRLPDFERLRSIHSKIVQGRPVPVLAKLGASEPARRKLFPAISHVFPAEDSKREHLPRRQPRRKFRSKFAADRFRPPVDVRLLHPVVHQYPDRFHSFRCSGACLTRNPIPISCG